MRLPHLPLLPALPLRVPALRDLLPGPHEPRVVVVTGASSGIGRATALRASTAGDHVVLVARHEDHLDDVAADCRDGGAASTLVVPADVGDDQQVAQLVGRVVDEHGRVDAVLHCAGVVAYGRTEEVPAEVFDAVIRTNLLGSVNVARHTLRLLREQERGTLVLVGSLLGHIAVPDMTPYVVSKWGVRALARQLAIENIDLPHVSVCHVSPGSVDTPIYDNPLDAGGTVHEPPPPSISPERVARVVYDQVAAPRATSQTALTNYGMLAAFTLVPGVYDRLIGPVFGALSRHEAEPDGGVDADGVRAGSTATCSTVGAAARE